MRYIINFLHFNMALAFLLLGSCEKTEPGRSYRIMGNMDIDGLNRTYLLNLPSNYYEVDSFSLVVALHGTGGSAAQCERDYGLTYLADSLNYIIVYPEGMARPGPLKIRTWNAGQCCDYAVENQIDDVRYIGALIDGMVNRFMVDPNKVFVTGMSNGAMMAYRLACEIPDRINAIAPVSGTLMTAAPCQPSGTTPVLHIHSELDEVIPYGGGVGLGGYYFHPVDSALQVMAAIDKCPISPNITQENTGYTYRKWSCEGNVKIESYVTKDGGHAWPGGKKPREGADEPSTSIDATQLIFEFFEQYNR